MGRFKGCSDGDDWSSGVDNVCQARIVVFQIYEWCRRFVVQLCVVHGEWLVGTDSQGDTS